MGALQATTLLIRDKCDILIHINVNVEKTVTAYDRIRAFKETCEEYQVPYDIDLSVSGNSYQEILNEIRRILTVGGRLIFRVNSVNDVNHGAGQGNEIEHHLYETSDKRLKRFFDEKDIKFFFKDFDIEYLNEEIMTRYKLEKRLYRVCVRKK